MIIDETERLIIKEFDKTELELGCRCFNLFDSEGHEYTKEMMEAYIELAYGFYGYGYYGLYLKDTMEAIGVAGFREGSCPPEVGYALFDGLRGKGYATEAVKSLVEWAQEDFLWCLDEGPADSFYQIDENEEVYVFEHEGKPLVYAKVDKGNVKSAEVVLRNGFVKVNPAVYR